MNPFIFNSQVTQLFIATSVSLVIYYNGIRRRHRLTISGILQPGRSLWRHLYENGDEASFLNLTGFSRAAIHQLHEYMYRDNELPRTGRPRLLNTEDEMGMDKWLYVFAPCCLPRFLGGSSLLVTMVFDFPIRNDSCSERMCR